MLAVILDLVRAGALLIAAGCAILAVAAQGGRFSDRLDVLTHFAPVLLGSAMLAILVWFVAGRHGKATPALAAVAAISTLVLMAPELMAQRRQAAVSADGQSLRILQFNLWGRNRDPESSARWILEQDPDIVVLEEAFARSSGGVASALAERYPHRVTCAEPRACSTMILSKRRPSDGGGLQNPVDRLSGAWATFRSPQGPFTVVGVHLTWPIPAGPQQQQSKRLAKALEAFPKDRLIVAGDFNSTPWSFSLRRQDVAFGLERRTRALFSWPAGVFSRLGIALPFPILAIDQVYAGRGWSTVSAKRGPMLGSDHYPVLIELTPRPTR